MKTIVAANNFRVMRGEGEMAFVWARDDISKRFPNQI
jgi:hypothetical protein